ncbi:MAG TPA: putative peptidoglycan-binding domain-containing protein, partial [Niabella sp.]|nr:putative peptidoglycan-binding domain-containing protein [Niabella sp.]
GITADGVVGAVTLTTINGRDAKTLFDALKRERTIFLTQLSHQPGQAKFRTGWLNRVNSF